MTISIGDGSRSNDSRSNDSNSNERLSPKPRRSDTNPCNVGLRLTEQAIQRPDQLAIATPTGSHRRGTSRRYHTISMADLDHRSTSLAAGFQAMGMGPGKKIALLVRFGEDFITLVFALLKCGVTLVLIDPGMGRKNILNCLQATSPDGLVAIPIAQAIV